MDKPMLSTPVPPAASRPGSLRRLLPWALHEWRLLAAGAVFLVIATATSLLYRRLLERQFVSA